MGKAEKQICSQEGQKPSSNECRCQEEVVGVDEGAVGSEEKVESIVPLSRPREKRDPRLTRGVYSVWLLGTKPEIPVDAVFAFITVNQT